MQKQKFTSTNCRVIILVIVILLSMNASGCSLSPTTYNSTIPSLSPAPTLISTHESMDPTIKGTASLDSESNFTSHSTLISKSMTSKSLSPTSAITPTAVPTVIPKVTPDLPAYGEIAYSQIIALINEIGIRYEGTSSASACAEYINKKFLDLGYNPVTQNIKFTAKRNGVRQVIDSKNVIAVKKGTSDKELIVCAHYDSVNIGLGVDDNASRIAVIFELAQRLQNIKTPYTIRFITFGGEEDGMMGSKYYVSQMTENDIAKTINVINIDSILAGNKKYVYGDFGSDGVIRDYAIKISQEMNLGLITQRNSTEFPEGTTGPWSDFYPFNEKGIPYTYFEATDWELGEKDGYTQVSLEYGEKGEIWHTKYDTLEYINSNFPGRAKEHLSSFVKILMKILTDFKI